QVEELHPAIAVLLGNRDHQAEIGFHHFALGDMGLALALLPRPYDPAEFRDRAARLGGERVDRGAMLADPFPLARGETLPAPGGKLGHAVEPERIELEAAIRREEIFARDPV